MTFENIEDAQFPSEKKPTLLYAWELGANFGHIGAFLPLARALREAGFPLHWVVAQTGPAARLLADEGFAWLQAPVAPERRYPGPPLSYADILRRFAYADPRDLLGLVEGWRQLILLTGATLVLADHGPTAVLAARSLGVPVMLFSNGFTVPPRRAPLPNMRPWLPLEEAQLGAIDAHVLDSVNRVLAHYGAPGLTRLCDLFDVAEEALLTYPELDHYADRGPASYWGSLPQADAAFPPPWPEGTGPRLFAYLRQETPNWQGVLAALAANSALRAVVYFPDLAAADRQRFSRPGLVFVDQPVDIGRAAREADGAITYASLATTTAFLLAGKPLLLMPAHLEQFLLARRVAEMGAGLFVNPDQPAGDLSPALASLLGNPLLAENARAFARKYAAFGQERVVANLVRRIRELCNLDDRS